jgi:hypothetical protein
MTLHKEPLVICEICGSAQPSGTPDFIVFHCLTLCSPDCLDEYRAADEERHARKDAAVAPARPRKRARKRAGAA